MTAVLDPQSTPLAGVRAGAFGNATHLVCRACGQQTRARPALRLSGVFRPARGRLRVPAGDPRADRGGPRSIWRYAPLLPVPADIATFRSTDPGFTRLVDARHLADDLGLRQLWVKDDSGNPTHSFKDRVVAVALSAARELGLQVLACPSTGNLANAVAAAAARAGIRSVVFVPENLEQAKIVASAVYGTTLVAVKGTYDDVNKLASEIAARGGGLGVRQRQRPAVLRRGLQDAGLRDRRAARLAAAGPGRGPGGQRLPADQDRQGLPRAGQPRPGRGQAVPDLRRPGHGLLAGRAGRTGPARTSSRRSSRTPSPSRWPSATRRTARTCWTWCGGPAARWPTSTTTTVVGRHPAAGPDRGHLRRDGRRRDGRGDREADRRRAARPGGRDRGDQLRRRAEDPGRGADRVGPEDHDPAPLRGVHRVLEGSSAMSATVRIPTILRTYTGGAGEVTADGSTLGEVLEALESRPPRHPRADPGRRAGRCAGSSTSTSATTTCGSSAGWTPRSPTAPRSRSSRRSPAAESHSRWRTPTDVGRSRHNILHVM